jgi:hypothetical protein
LISAARSEIKELMMKQSISCRAWFLLVPCIAACGGGGSAEGGTGGSRGAALRVVETTPADMATDVPTDVAVSAVFDDALRETTVTATAFTLQQGQEALQGAVSLAAEQTAVFTPDNSLALLATYTATLTTEVESLTGGTLGADYEWIFTTRDGLWGTAELIQTDSEGPAGFPQIAIDTGGNAVAVWHQSDLTRSKIWSNRYTPTGGWGIAQRIDGIIPNDARSPRVAVDPSGNALAVWVQSDNTQNSIWANRYTPDGGWEIAELIERDDAGAASPARVVIDPRGNALAVWVQVDGSRNIWANRYTPIDGWLVAQRIDGNNPNNGLGPQLAIDPDGNALAVWVQVEGTAIHIWSNRYTPGGGWRVPERIEENNAGTPQGPQVAIGPSGNALAVWAQDDGGGFNVVWSNRYTSTDGWETPERIDGNTSSEASIPQVAIDSNGNALAVWLQSDNAGNRIWANRYTPTGGWGIAEPIRTDVAGPSASNLDLAVDPRGNALIVWTQGGQVGSDTVWSNRYTLAGGWGIAESVRTDNTQRAFVPQVAIDPSGNALVVWYQDSSGFFEDIWSRRFE